MQPGECKGCHQVNDTAEAVPIKKCDKGLEQVRNLPKQL